MANIFSSLSRTVFLGFILALLLYWLSSCLISNVGSNVGITDYLLLLARWFHVLSAIMWIGLLWYFNFVQIPNMPNIPDNEKPAITKVIAPAALWWFRWGAMATIITGLILAHLNGYLYNALFFIDGFGGVPGNVIIGIGMWLGIVMWFNVWFIIWPNQKRVLGIVECEPENKLISARRAMLFSRINTMLSIPMLLAMVSVQYLFNNF